MHRTTPQFWRRFDRLPESVQRVARRNFRLLNSNPRYPSLHFKKVGKSSGRFVRDFLIGRSLVNFSYTSGNVYAMDQSAIQSQAKKAAEAERSASSQKGAARG